MTDNEIIGKINELIDRTRMGHVIWTEKQFGVFSNKKNDVAIGRWGIQFEVDKMGKVISSFDELRKKLYLVAEKSAIRNNKTFDDIWNIKRE